MSQTTCVFIDGNNFYHNIKKTGIKPSHVDYQKLRNILCEHFGCKHYQTHYYNSIPSLKDGAPLYYSHMSFLKGLEKIPDFFVKTRKLQRHSTEEILQRQRDLIENMHLCKICLPIVESTLSDAVGGIKKKEKGIDIMIAVDMLNLSVIAKKCDSCILFSGDADFHPALDIIRKYGIQVYSTSIPYGYSIELRSSFPYFILSKEFIIANCLKSGREISY